MLQVCIDDGEDRRDARHHPLHHRGRKPAPSDATDQPDVALLQRDRRDQLGGAVARSIVDEDRLPFGPDQRCLPDRRAEEDEMKLSHIAAATGLVLASLGAATSANAQPYDHGRQEWRHDDGGRWDRSHDRGWHRGGYHHCHTEWRHHHRVRICR